MKSIDCFKTLFRNSLYHIYNRGNEKEKIFFNKGNYISFLRRYNYYLSNCLDTFAYCLFPKHFHFLFKIKNDHILFINSSNLIQILKTQQCQNH